MERGWVKLWRKTLDNGLLRNPGLLTFWVWCLLKASHKKINIFVGNQQVCLNKGEFVFGRRQAAEELGFSQQNIRTFIKALKSTSNLTIKSTSKFSIISIVNWDIYQNEDKKTNQQNDQQTNQPLTNNQPTTNQQLTTNKNEKNEKNEKNKGNGSLTLPDFISESLFNDFLDHRKKLRKPMTDKAKEIFVRKVVSLHSKGFNPTELIETAIERGWQTVFEPTEKRDGLDEFLRRHKATK